MSLRYGVIVCAVLALVGFVHGQVLAQPVQPPVGEETKREIADNAVKTGQVADHSGERAAKTEQHDRVEKAQRPERAERPQRPERSEKPVRSGKF